VESELDSRIYVRLFAPISRHSQSIEETIAVFHIEVNELTFAIHGEDVVGTFSLEET
jgi:hypothetical protein